MGLFSKYSNLYFSVGRKIIEVANNDGVISERRLNELIRKHGVFDDNHDFANAIIGRSGSDNKFHGICIIEPAGIKAYRSIIGSLPLVLSKSERNALIECLSSDIAVAFIPEETLEKFGVTSKASAIAETLGKVVVAIKSNKWFSFDNNAADENFYSGQHLKPTKIEYSLSTEEYFVSGYCKEASRLIKCNLKRIKIHGIVDGDAIDTDSALVQKRCSEPICLSIVNQKNAIDRAFNMFSSYERDGFYDKMVDRYILNIYYYKFEERLLIDKILSLGAAALVVSPSVVKAKIVGRVRQQLFKLT